MPAPDLSLEEKLRRSVFEAQARKRSDTNDLDTWRELMPLPPKRLTRRKKMNANLAVIDPGTMLERVVVHGDLSKLTPGDRAAYYGQVCSSLGLNPLTRPFEYLTLNGKQILYARRDCTDQLRKIHGVSVTIRAREQIGDLLVVTAQAELPGGRRDESTGAVSVGSLKGEALANAMMKAETKAKRRVTLSICGLAVLDESEVDGAKATDTGGGYSPHLVPGEDPNAPGDPDLFRDLCGRLSVVESDLETCDSWDKCNALRAILGTKAKQSELTRTMQLKAESGDISPSQRQELGRTWQRANRKLEGLEKKLAPPIEATFERQPGDDESEDL
jgi:hypothetical protein